MKKLIRKILKEETSSFEKTKKLVLDMFNEGFDFYEIKSMTGLSLEILVLCLKNEKLIKTFDIPLIYDLLYNVLFDTDLINKKEVFNDGSKLLVKYVRFGGTLEIRYYDDEGLMYDGYGTLLWNNDLVLPIEIDFLQKGKKEYDVGSSTYIDFLSYDRSFMDIKSLNDIIEYFNKNYFILVKKTIDDNHDFFYDYIDHK